MNHPDSAWLLSTMSDLYELSLSIGSSLDLQKNCETFFRILMSRKNLAQLALWLSEGDTGEQLRCAFSFPRSSTDATLTLPGGALLSTSPVGQSMPVAALPAHLAPLTPSSSTGIFTLLPLKEGLGVVVFTAQSRREPLTRQELNQLSFLMNKFSDSVTACLQHQRLTDEIAERRKAEERERALQVRLARLDRMRAVSELISHVAHDLNNLFSPIVQYPELLLDSLPDDNPLRPDLEAIRKSGLTAGAMVRDLLAFARDSRRARTPLDVVGISQEFMASTVVRDLESRFPKVTVTLRISEPVSAPLGIGIHITQVLMNLVTNAAEASAHGEIMVCLEDRTLREAHLGYEPIPAGHYTTLSVVDSGPGIPEEVLDRIFEPYFSQKRLGRSGSGLGLAAVFRIVKDCGGYIDVITRQGQGTRFDLYLHPATDDVAASPAPVLRDEVTR